MCRRLFLLLLQTYFFRTFPLCAGFLFCFLKGFVYQGLWHLCHHDTALHRIPGTLVEGPTFNSSEIVGPKEKAKEDNSAPVFCIVKPCGKDRNSTE